MSDIAARYPGATEQEWMHFAKTLGLEKDLLPVVSNTEADICDYSTLSKTNLGKTPSVYSRNGCVKGIRSWPEHCANDEDIRSWSECGDYGICIICRDVRGLDLDIESASKVEQAIEIIRKYLPEAPIRSRKNSCRKLIAFRVQGDMGKGVLKVGDGDLIEFLGTGQQFVAAGEHRSGVRYEWGETLPPEIPEITQDQFDLLWKDLEKNLATSPGSRRSGGRKTGADIVMDDPVVDFLHENGFVASRNRNGNLNIACPWEHEHTMGEPGDGSTVWMPAGTNGYAEGNFRCLHGHCEDRSTSDFLSEIGYESKKLLDEFGPDFVMPDFNLDRHGMVYASRENLVMALSLPELTGCNLRFDEFSASALISVDEGPFVPFEDAHYVLISLRLVNMRGGLRFIEPQKEKLRDVIDYVARERSFDVAQNWISQLEWDGIERISSFLPDYFGTVSDEYHQALGCYFWTALAGRVLVPGVKADNILIASGLQGLNKSSIVSAISPFPEAFGELDLAAKDADISRQLIGKLILELSELKGMRAKEMSHLKQFVSRREEEWIPKYKEKNARYKRRCMFIGTTNETDFLVDETGNRRWLPFKAGVCKPELLEQTRDQLWAEARELFNAHGVMWQGLSELATEHHPSYMEDDVWFDAVRDYLFEVDDCLGRSPSQDAISISDILARCLHVDLPYQDQRMKNRISKILRRLGFEQRTEGPKEHRRRVYRLVE